LILSRAFYTFYYAAGACLMPFLPIYFSDLGFSGGQIGVLRAIAPLMTLVSGPLWSGLADVTRRHKAFWLVAIAGSWGAVLALSRASSYRVLIAIVVVQAFFAAPIVPLIDSAVLALLGSRKERYGSLRLWGAVGWGIGGLLVGQLIDRYGLHWAFIGYLLLFGVTGLTAFGIPAAYAEVERDFWRDLRALFADGAWTTFLATILIGGLYLAVEVNYLMLYMDRRGASPALMGVMLAVATVSELPVWALAPRWLKRWGPRGVLSLAFLTGAVQALAYAWLPALWLALPVQLLHGLAFSAMWTAGVTYAAEVAPEGTQATAQGVFGGVQMGLCAMTGAFAGGVLFDRVGGARTFLIAAVPPLLALLLVRLVLPQPAPDT
jgi:PPP family 3-phenylpropionic acid transporter